MTHGELFAGISGFGVGFERAGIKARWHVEIDPFCRSVLRHHYPDSALFADVCEVGSHNLSSVDVISFGSPCQDLSMAGRRAGLAGERSGLFYEAIRIVAECEPTFAVWENVPGAFSSNAGRDFAAVLGAFRDIGARDIAWRVVDAQYAGVAQRRRRVFVVADFGGERAAQILFEPECRSGDSPPSRGEGARAASALTRGANTAGRRQEDGDNIVPEVSLCLKAQSNDKQDPTHQTYVAVSTNQRGEGRLREVHGSLAASRSAKQFDGVMAFGYQGRDDLGHALRSEPSRADKPSSSTYVAHSGVRRLTPTECERLQGFPDGWTAVDGAADSPRYRALGNAVCVNVAAWLGKRIMAAHRDARTDG